MEHPTITSLRQNGGAGPSSARPEKAMKKTNKTAKAPESNMDMFSLKKPLSEMTIEELDALEAMVHGGDKPNADAPAAINAAAANSTAAQPAIPYASHPSRQQQRPSSSAAQKKTVEEKTAEKKTTKKNTDNLPTKQQLEHPTFSDLNPPASASGSFYVTAGRNDLADQLTHRFVAILNALEEHKDSRDEVKMQVHREIVLQLSEAITMVVVGSS